MAKFEFKVDPERLRSGTVTFSIHHPKFTGNYTAPFGSITREQRVMQALFDIYGKLNGGCIRDNTALDASVDAFRDGHLNRQEVSNCIMADFRGMNNITFDCVDTTDDDLVAAYWTPNTNTITLKWAPSWGPSNYAILSEFVHKCGFNDYLMQWYPGPPENPHGPIEYQVDLVTSSCYP